MDNYSAGEERYLALLEQMILDAGLTLPGVYEGLHGKELKEHQQRIREIRWPKKSPRGVLFH